MREKPKFFFVIHMKVSGADGLALVISYNERDAVSCLKRQGQYNGTPDLYIAEDIDNLGHYCGPAYGLYFESYVDALVAYEAIHQLMQGLILQQGLLISKEEYDELALHRQRNSKKEAFADYYAFCEDCKAKARAKLGIN